MSLFDRVFGHQANAHYQQAMHAYNKGDFETALSGFEGVLQRATRASDPLHSLSRFYAAEAAHHLGNACLERHEPERASEYYERALRWNPLCPALQYHLALACTELGAHQRARSHLDLALQQNPNDQDAKELDAALRATASHH